MLIKKMPLHIRRLIKFRQRRPAKNLDQAFNWPNSKEGRKFWYEINEGNFEVYWEEYPRKKPRKPKKNLVMS